MSKAEEFITNRLAQRLDQGILRSLPVDNRQIDFCSNDYLGFARSIKLKRATEQVLSELGQHLNGATGSRLISGNTAFTESTEALIAKFHHAEAGLIFNSGYDANVGLISSLAQRGDTIIADEFIHASLIDGARLSHANRYTFKHNDLTELEVKLKIAKGNIYVLVESIYSMDGDMAPLEDIVTLCRQYQAEVVVDEAHSFGIHGEHGRGLINELGLEKKVFARVITFGKALGCHGAIVLGSHALRNYLINFARTFIYTTALPQHSVAAIKAAYSLLVESDHVALIRNKVAYYASTLDKMGLTPTYFPAPGAIQTILYNNAVKARRAAQTLQDNNLNVRAILSPTVLEGKERLRICLHSFNTYEEIDKLINALKTLKANE